MPLLSSSQVIYEMHTSIAIVFVRFFVSQVLIHFYFRNIVLLAFLVLFLLFWELFSSNAIKKKGAKKQSCYHEFTVVSLLGTNCCCFTGVSQELCLYTLQCADFQEP
jgi:hypothetical protein